MKPIYTAGYAGHTPQELKQVAELLGAVVFDIRLSPRSRVHGWNFDELLALFKDGDYLPVQTLGNLNYLGGPIRICDAANGLHQVNMQSLTRPVILLCGCQNYESCHRSHVAQLLHDRGIKTSEITWPDANTDKSTRMLTLWNPWAALVAIGAKGVETRHWATDYRGPLAIHAAKTKEHMANLHPAMVEALKEDGYSFDPVLGWTKGCPFEDSYEELPFGAVVCVVDLVDCIATEKLMRDGKISTYEAHFGNYAAGRFGFVLENPRRLKKPLPYRGSQKWGRVDLTDVEFTEAAKQGVIR